MNHIFISTTGQFLEEVYHYKHGLVQSSRERTEKKTKAMMEELSSLGSYVRVGETLWFLLTTSSTGEVEGQISSGFERRFSLSDNDLGTMLVACVNEFTLSRTSVESLRTMESIIKADPSMPPDLHFQSEDMPSKTVDFNYPTRTQQPAKKQNKKKKHGVKSTDALLRRVSGSYGSGRRK